jgi:hypothetical protein
VRTPVTKCIVIYLGTGQLKCELYGSVTFTHLTPLLGVGNDRFVTADVIRGEEARRQDTGKTRLDVLAL